ncbi:MAG: nuclear transport factor 2 family protein [Rhodoferax sp.]|nr:nuclear transport factor 2 family protein [Rhodoferax sp.]
MGAMSDAYRKSLDAWSRGDVEGMFADYADDVVWYPNRSMRPVHGKEAMRAFMAKFAKGMSDISYQQTHMVESGNMLFVEGTENYTKNGKKISVPYAGVVEFRDGKFVAWRDYFDLKSLEAELAR